MDVFVVFPRSYHCLYSSVVQLLTVPAVLSVALGYSPAGRSVLGKTVLEVLDTQDAGVLMTEGIVFSI